MCSLCCCQIRLRLVRSMFQPYSYNKFDSKFISNVKPACRPVLNCFRVPNPPLYLLLIYSTNCTSCLISTVNLDLSSHYIDPDLLSFCVKVCELYALHLHAQTQVLLLFLNIAPPLCWYYFISIKLFFQELLHLGSQLT